MDAATAKRLLDQYRPVVRALVRLYPDFVRDDLLASGDLAILEAFVSWKADKGANEGTWIRRMIHWRLAQCSKDELDDPLALADQFQEELVSDTHDTEREVLQNLALRAIHTLSPRHQAVIQGRLQNETFEEIATSLGISTARAGFEGLRALQLLRAALEGASPCADHSEDESSDSLL